MKEARRINASNASNDSDAKFYFRKANTDENVASPMMALGTTESVRMNMTIQDNRQKFNNTLARHNFSSIERNLEKIEENRVSDLESEVSEKGEVEVKQ